MSSSTVLLSAVANEGAKLHSSAPKSLEQAPVSLSFSRNPGGNWDLENEGDVDRISDLPDDIIINYFITPLNFKERTKIATLSKRWRDLSTHCTEFDIDLSSTMLNTKKSRIILLNSVDHVLSSHRAPSIVKFHVNLCLSSEIEDAPNRVDRLVEFALSRRVKDLRLECSNVPINTITLDIFKHSPYVDGNHGISSLTSLQLVNIDISGDVVEFILGHCHLLQCLLVELSYSLVSLVVRSSKLKRLALVGCGYLRELELEAESLIYFNYNDICAREAANISFKSVPLLVEASIGGHCCGPPYAIFRHIAPLSMQLSKLSLDITDVFYLWHTSINYRGDALPSFCNVKHLEFCAKYTGSELPCAVRFIEACPRLNKLDLKLILKKGIFPRDIWPMPVLLTGEELESESEEDQESEGILEIEEEPCIEHRSLRVLEIKGFMGCVVDVELIMFILESAINLETIICDPRGPSGEADHPSHVVEESRLRALKLANILPPRINFVVI